MSKLTELIEEHLRKANEEYQNGRYENAEHELNIVHTKIEKEIKQIKPPNLKEDESKLANSYLVLSELNHHLQRVKTRLKLVMAEKERARRFRAIRKGIYDEAVVDTIKKNLKMMEEFRDRERTIEKNDRVFKVLRRWNSYTPLLCLDTIENLGGGYFLAWRGKGIAIDPGISFIQNAVSCGLSIKDIDIVVLTHSHVDHTSDFEGLVTLFHEINTLRYDVGLDPTQFSLYASIGAVNKYCNLVSLCYDIFKEIHIVNPNSSYILSESIFMKTTPCQHKDLFCSHSSSCVGLKFYQTGETEPIIAITSDTGYNAQIKNSFADVKNGLIVLHIGGIKDEEMKLTPSPVFPVYASHLGLRGVLNFIFDVHPSVAIISEFGEEFRGTRVDISGLFDQEFKATTVIPGDVGLTIRFSEKKPCFLVTCSECKSDVSMKELRTVLLGKGANLLYLCSKCVAKRKNRPCTSKQNQ